ncbi:MAG: lytic transglycosylase domain-containing protein [Candidatus Nitrospinota bacterium M3_3B_026]
MPTFTPRAVIATLAMALILCGQARADIYMLRDSRGIVYFTDTPPANSGYEIIKSYTIPKGAPLAALTPGRSRPAASSMYDRIITEAARRHGLDPMLIKAVIEVESGFDRFSISSKGARGLMQLMPGTARLLGVHNVYDPALNIDGGSRYLRMMLDEFGGDLRLALAAYNAGPTAVKRYGGTPPYRETMRYIDKVYAAYRAHAGRAAPARSGMVEGAARAAVYTYTSGGGGAVFTDLPVGKAVDITD